MKKSIAAILVICLFFVSACSSGQPVNEQQNIIRSQPVDKDSVVDKFVVQTPDEPQEEESELVAGSEIDVETAELPLEEDEETAVEGTAEEAAAEEVEETVEKNKVKVDISQEELDKLRKDIEGIETEDLGGLSSD